MSVFRRVFAVLVIGFVAAAAYAAGSVNDSTVISQSDSLTLDVAAYRAHLSGRDNDELGYLSKGDKELMDRALDFHSDSVLMKQAEALGLDKDPVIANKLADARRKILVMSYMAKVRREVEFGDVEALARERYALRKPKLVTPERRKVAHILLTDNPSCTCDKRPPAIQRVKTVLEQIRAGADFAELAKTESSDRATAPNGGAIDKWIEENGETIRAFEDATFKLAKVGDVSDPVITNFGIHVIKLLEVQQPRQLSFEEVRDQLIAEVKTAAINSALDKARSQAYPDPDTINLSALKDVLKDVRGR